MTSEVHSPASDLERVLLEVGQGVLEPDVQVGDPGQGILRTWPT